MPANKSSLPTPVFQKTPPPGTTPAAPDVSDIGHMHQMVASNYLANVFAQIAKKAK